MAVFSQTITEIVAASGVGISSSNTFSGDGRSGRSVTVPASTTDHFVDLAINVSEIQSIYMVSDQALTVETNSASVPDDTIVLIAGRPYIWSVNSYFANLFTTDVTALYLTNAVGTDAVFQLEVVVDATP